jgi:hypothetical protein
MTTRNAHPDGVNPLKRAARLADALIMNAPRITAADLKDAATRLAGTVVAFIEDNTTGTAVYKPRLEAWVNLDGDDLGTDDGTILDLLNGVPAREVIAEHGGAGRAAQALNARIRREWGAA